MQNDTTAWNLKKPCIDIIARVKPKNIEPVSPMNIFAGLKLNGRKPIQLPARMPVMRITVSVASSTKNEARSIEHAEIADTPQERPSRPSMRFVAFMRNTIQNTVSGIENEPNSRFLPKNVIRVITLPEQAATPLRRLSEVRASEMH